MTVPQIVNIPQSTDTRQDFNAKADALFPQVNTAFALLNADLASSNASSIAASASAISAENAKNISLANAAYKGLWAGLTGALTVPASVLHLDRLWMLTSNLANVTTGEPSISSAWLPIDGIGLSKPSAMPSLLLDFTNVKSLDSRFTFTRASTATRYNQNGFREITASGQPRIDFNPYTLECNGLLSEQASTNLLLWSNDFTNAAWSKPNCTVTANNALGADNASSASTLNFGADIFGGIYQNLNQAGTSSQTFSLDIKSTNCSDVELSILWFGSLNEIVKLKFNPITGQFISIDNYLASLEGYSIKNLKNGLFRVSVSGKGNNPANTNVQFSLYEAIAGACSVVVGSFQAEAIGFSTSYVGHTTTAAITRTSDAVTLVSIGSTKWFNAKEGTLVVESCLNSTSTTPIDTYTAVFSDGTNNNRVLLKSFLNAGVCNFRGVIDNTAVSVFLSSILTNKIGKFAKHAIAYKDNDNAYSINGSYLSTGAGAIPSLTSMALAVNGSQCIKSVAYYSVRLPNNELLAASRS